MHFLKLCPNFVGSFDWKIFIYQKLSKFCFHLSTHSVNFDLKMFYIFLVCSMIKFSHVFAKKIQFTFMGLWSRKNNKNWKNIHNIDIKHAKNKELKWSLLSPDVFVEHSNFYFTFDKSWYQFQVKFKVILSGLFLLKMWFFQITFFHI